VGTWTRQGCWTEATNGRALTGKSYASDDMTLESCAAFCTGFAYFGAEYGRECYCGNTLQPGAVSAANQADCNFLCKGDANEYCGAGSRLELYRAGGAGGAGGATSTTTSAAPTATPTASTTTTAAAGTTSTSSAAPIPTGFNPGDANFALYGCVSEPSAGRLLSNLVEGSNAMTISRCLSQCTQYAFAGVEYGQECWCGNTLNLAGNAGAVPGHNTTITECNFRCPGNQAEFCGAGGRLITYRRRT
jgi:hypothetical protein